MEFGCEGQAGKIKAVPLEDIARQYAAGALAQQVR
jgi:fructose-bisphosphate aldolase class II